MMTSSQHSAASSCTNSVSYAQWLPQPQTGGPTPGHYSNGSEHFYNNPVQYNSNHRCHSIPSPGPPHPPMPAYYPLPVGGPPSNYYTGAMPDYIQQPYGGGCSSGRYPPRSYESLHLQQQHHNPTSEWFAHQQQIHQHPPQLYTCSSDCSDHSLKSHSHHSHLSNCGSSEVPTSSVRPAKSISSTKSSRCANSSNNIYENDDDDDVEMKSEESVANSSGEGNGSKINDDRGVQTGHRDSNSSSDVTADRTSFAYSESIYAEAVDPAETSTLCN